MTGKDTASNAVNAVTYNAQLARKVAQAQLKRRGLKRELNTAETQLAQVTLYLAEQGSVAHPELEEPVRRARARPGRAERARRRDRPPHGPVHDQAAVVRRRRAEASAVEGEVVD